MVSTKNIEVIKTLLSEVETVKNGGYTTSRKTEVEKFNYNVVADTIHREICTAIKGVKDYFDILDSFSVQTKEICGSHTTEIIFRVEQLAKRLGSF